MFRWPQTRKDFWFKKIRKNVERDRISILHLQELGWRVMVVWECALKGSGRYSEDHVIGRCKNFVYDTKKVTEAIRGTKSR